MGGRIMHALGAISSPSWLPRPAFVTVPWASVGRVLRLPPVHGVYTVRRLVACGSAIPAF
jgi:hypothetical protein